VHSHLLLGNVQVLEQKLVDLWGKSLLKDREERVRLATHCHSQGKVFHPILNISSCQKLFSHLDFLEEEPLDSLLVREVWKLWTCRLGLPL